MSADPRPSEPGDVPSGLEEAHQAGVDCLKATRNLILGLLAGKTPAVCAQLLDALALAVEAGQDLLHPDATVTIELTAPPPSGGKLVRLGGLEHEGPHR